MPRGGDGHRVDLRVLLLSADGEEPAFRAWEAALEREGVPYDAIVARRGHPPIDTRTLAVGPAHARYQAVIVAVGGLPALDGGRYVSVLTADEWAALAGFEREFGIRRITAFAYPSALTGHSAPASSGVVGELSGTLTPAGREVFAGLRGDVPLDPNAYGHLAEPAGDRFTTLVAGPQGGALVGVHAHPDGREEMVCTVDGNAGMIHVQLLRHGMLRWVTRGVFLGQERHYLGLQVDDVFLSDDSWDPAAARTVPGEIRMRPADVEAAVRWSRARGVRLDLGFNGHGAQPADELSAALLAHAPDFGWINHTFGHADFDAVDAATMHAEIAGNIAFAAAAGLPIDAGELVTGGHSGLRNADLPGVLAQTGVRWIATDNSHDPVQRRIGPARTVPRHPTNVYFNVCERAAQLDEYEHLSAIRAAVVPIGATRIKPAATTTWARFVELEARTMLDHVLGNDPRPHYLHQSNLAGDRMLFDLVDEVLRRHRELFTVELVQPSLADAGAELARRAAWQDALHDRCVTAYVRGGRLHLSSTEPVQIPVTGGAAAAEHEPSTWTELIGPLDGHVVCALA
ncbi:MAG: hypothetical protein QOD69_802 [Solirubrobacteraceae bacterium]|nr:hypothetical protein [Solirubrobacteraceae bacterium]